MFDNVFDLHCDLPTAVYIDKKPIGSNDCHWSVDKIPFRCFTQFFATYINQTTVKNPFSYAKNMITAFKNEVEKTDGICLAENRSDIENNQKRGLNSAVLTIEGGEALEGKIENLNYFYKLGVRLMTLTWNFENELAYGVMENKDTKPLKPFGLKAVNKMETLGMIVDVSHVNEGGFWSVAEHASKPFAASHSNARSVCKHKRNLTDDQIRCIIDLGGIIGLNFYPVFLNDSGYADVTDILRHIDHFLSLGAENNIMLGCDFDGIDTTLRGLENISKLPYLIEEMQKNHFNDDIIAKIFQNNGKRWLNSMFF